MGLEDSRVSAFIEELCRTCFESLVFDRGIGGDHEDRDGPLTQAQFKNELGTAHLPQVLAGDEELCAGMANMGQGILRIRESSDAAFRVQAGQHPVQEEQEIRVIIDEGDAMSFHPV